MAVPCDFQKVRDNAGCGEIMALIETNGGEVVASPHGEIARWTGGGARAEPPFPNDGKNRAFNWWTDNTEWAPPRPPHSDMWHDWGLQPCEL